MSRNKGPCRAPARLWTCGRPGPHPRGSWGHPAQGCGRGGQPGAPPCSAFGGRGAGGQRECPVPRLHDADRVYCRSAGRGPDGSSQTTGGSGLASSDPFSHDNHKEVGVGSKPRLPRPPARPQGGPRGREGRRGGAGRARAAPPQDTRALDACRPAGASDRFPE